MGGLAAAPARVLQRTLAEIDRAVLICTVVLFAVIVTSTLVLCLGVEKFKVIDALFRTVSVMATGASMHEEDLGDSSSMKLFVASLRILGAALTAAFTAIVTNYLLRAAGGALNCAASLTAATSSSAAWAPSASASSRSCCVRRAGGGDRTRRGQSLRPRRPASGAPVIIGDAGVSGVLGEAHAATSRAVIASTDDDLTNLAIALLVRELHAGHRVVLLLADPELARMLREAADVRLALSVPILAAPAFLASLFGDRVLSVFQFRERLFAVIDLLIQPNDPFVNHSVRAMSVDYHLQAVAPLPAEGPPPHPLLAGRLGAGDRLIAIIALTDLGASVATPAVFRRLRC